MKRLKNIEGKNEQQIEAIKNQRRKQLETIKDQKEEQLDAISNQDGVSIGDKNRVKNKSIFETIVEVSKNKNAKNAVEKLEKIDEKINFDKLSITDKNDKEIIGFAEFEYMNLNFFARRIFYGSISLKKQKKCKMRWNQK